MRTLIDYIRFCLALRRFNRTLAQAQAEMARLQEAFDRTGITQSTRRFS